MTDRERTQDDLQARVEVFPAERDEAVTGATRTIVAGGGGERVGNRRGDEERE